MIKLIKSIVKCNKCKKRFTVTKKDKEFFFEYYSKEDIKCNDCGKRGKRSFFNIVDDIKKFEDAINNIRFEGEKNGINN